MLRAFLTNPALTGFVSEGVHSQSESLGQTYGESLSQSQASKPVGGLRGAHNVYSARGNALPANLSGRVAAVEPDSGRNNCASVGLAYDAPASASHSLRSISSSFGASSGSSSSLPPSLNSDVFGMDATVQIVKELFDNALDSFGPTSEGEAVDEAAASWDRRSRKNFEKSDSSRRRNRDRGTDRNRKRAALARRSRRRISVTLRDEVCVPPDQGSFVPYASFARFTVTDTGRGIEHVERAVQSFQTTKGDGDSNDSDNSNNSNSNSKSNSNSSNSNSNSNSSNYNNDYSYYSNHSNSNSAPTVGKYGIGLTLTILYSYFHTNTPTSITTSTGDEVTSYQLKPDAENDKIQILEVRRVSR